MKAFYAKKWIYMNQKNKRYLYWFVGIVVIIIIFTAIIFLQSPKPQVSTLVQNKSTFITQRGHIKNNTTIVTSPALDPAQAAALQFYTYYFSTPQNPLANGAYKNNPYLSPDFKNIVGALYDNGNAPVFCAQNKSDKVVVDKEEKVNYNQSYLMQEVISEAPPGTRDLYMMLLENVNGKWLIFDVNCIQ